MVNFPGRNGRRRRVLNEEVLSASSSQAARRALAAAGPEYEAPRYSDAAGVENHPQITDFIPRRYRTIGLLLVTGTLTAAVLGALHQLAPDIAAVAGLAALRPFDLAAPGSLADWIAAVILLLSSGLSLMVYSLRRHRVDDIRGRYRVWFAAGVLCFALSANSVAAIHQVLASSLSHVTGWTALRDGSAWWLIVAGPPIVWIAIRALLDVRECRFAFSLLTASLASHAVALASFLGWVPMVLPMNEPLISGVAHYLGHWLGFATLVTYARYVVLDAQGLIPARRPMVKRSDAKVMPRVANPTPAQPTEISPAGRNRQTPPSDADATEKWIDGSRPEREAYDDGDDEDASCGRKLSKADRKRLRKFKAQNRAA